MKLSRDDVSQFVNNRETFHLAMQSKWLDDAQTELVNLYNWIYVKCSRIKYLVPQRYSMHASCQGIETAA